MFILILFYNYQYEVIEKNQRFYYILISLSTEIPWEMLSVGTDITDEV